MGTPSVTVILDDENKQDLVAILRQFDDGYWDVLRRLLKGRRVCDGYTAEDVGGALNNGMGCLAAWLITKLKEACPIGCVYVYPTPLPWPFARLTNDCGADWIYIVSSEALQDCTDSREIVVRGLSLYPCGPVGKEFRSVTCPEGAALSREDVAGYLGRSKP